MKKFLSFIKRAPKRSAILLALGLALLIPAVINAWGPSSRPTYTIEKPADHVTFNSITNNPAYGDERNFAHIKEAGTAGSAYTNDITLQPGKTYDVFAYYHNNAASNLNNLDANGKTVAANTGIGVAKGAFMRVEFPEVVNGQAAGNIYVGASNANPAQVWDTITFHSTGNVTLSYVAGTAILHNRGALNGSALPTALFDNSGTAIGYNQWGIEPGCNEYDGYVTFQIKANQPNFSINKQVRLVGQTAWQKSVTAKPGDQVQYMLTYSNTGTTVQSNVVLKDTLPQGVTYVAGSSKLKNSNYPDGTTVSDNVVTSGINIGNYGSGGVAYLMFTGQVAANDALATCGVNTLTNSGHVSTDNGSDDSTADVTVTKTCKETPKCEVPGKTDLDADDPNCKEDTPKCEVPGKTDLNADDPDCKVDKCTVPGQEDLDADDPNCKEAMCTIDGKETLAADDPDCKETPPEKCEVPGKTDLDKDDPNCKETPTTPVTPSTPGNLPTTGPTDTISAVLGTGSLTTSAGYFIASKRRKV
ncbi:DUF11 domain-containing protein [Candidatus Saccharibacteria bacterium]|nr:DUF11 domain-containing protein [Candidatus Saccharibacteria bacterium]